MSPRSWQTTLMVAPALYMSFLTTLASIEAPSRPFSVSLAVNETAECVAAAALPSATKVMSAAASSATALGSAEVGVKVAGSPPDLSATAVPTATARTAAEPMRNQGFLSTFATRRL